MKKVLLSFILFFFLSICFAQEKSKEQIKEEKRLAEKKKTQALIDTKNFEFVADMAYPQRGRSINMTTNPNYLRIKNDSLYSEMPFFGRAYSGVAYSGGGGLSFKGSMKDYSFKENKKNFLLKAEVKDNSDYYSVTLTIYFNGDASLHINSNNREGINYRGAIHEYKKK